MRLLSNRRWLGGVAITAGTWVVLGACNPSPVGVVDDDAGFEGGGEATFEASGDTTMDVGPEGSSGNDGSSDGTMPMPEASADANDGGAPESGAADANSGSEGGMDAGAETGSTQDASGEAAGDAAVDATNEAGADATNEAGDDAANEAGDDAMEEAATDAPAEAAIDAPAEAAADAPLEAAACAFAGTWSMTVQTVTAVPTLCQGVMDCTNCGVLFNATSTQSSATTIDWNVDPGGVLCTAFSGNITPAGQFTTNETNCSPTGNGSTFNGQIDLPTCSMTATYVYVLPNCTITETMTGTE
ncbi:MAG TPA: hypothetical protein VF765_35960 [Polyangiaceae bacterium]